MTTATFLSPKELATILGVSLQWVYAHTTGGREPIIPFIDFNGLTRFDPADIEDFILSRRVGPPRRTSALSSVDTRVECNGKVGGPPKQTTLDLGRG